MSDGLDYTYRVMESQPFSLVSRGRTMYNGGNAILTGREEDAVENKNQLSFYYLDFTIGQTSPKMTPLHGSIMIPCEVCRLKSRNVALILSLTCCGLGQIYKGEILKGINFILVYALLIASFFFCHTSSFLVHFSRLFILILMWLMGGLDAYVDDRILIERQRWLRWQRPLALLPAVVISGAIIMLVVLWSQFFSPMDRNLPDDANVGAISEGDNLDDAETIAESDITDFFSVQIAAFKDPAKAKITCNELLLKGYLARIERSESSEGNWHRVLIGKFQDDQEAISFAKMLYEKEGLPYIIVHRPEAGVK